MANKQSKFKNIVGNSTELLIASAAAVVFLILLTVIYSAAGVKSPILGIILTVLYIALTVCAVILFKTKKRGGIGDETVNKIMTNAMLNISVPTAICSERGAIMWNNGAFQMLASELGAGGNLRAKPITGMIPFTWSELATDRESGITAISGNSVFLVKNHPLSEDGRVLNIISVYDRTETENLRRELAEERTLVAHIQIDNLNELSQYEHGEYRDASRDVDAILKKWSDSVGGIMREYDKNKYIFFFKERYIDDFTLRKFDILDRVREVRVGEGFTPVTISMGISRDEGTLYECERASFAALDTALQRGGDQVVLRSDGGSEIYGGRTKTYQKRPKVRSRVIAGELMRHICNSGNVIIMGHRYPDFDSIGACIGIARLCIHCGVRANITTDVNDKNIKSCIEHVSGLPGYETMFVDGETALDMLRSDTLVIICDVNNFSHFAAPDVANSAQNIIIIDHHIKVADPPKEALLSYIEPAASSTCELIAEMLEQMYHSDGLSASEANVMYAGILLDTKQLTRCTSPRTFSAVMYMQDCGAKSEIAQEFFLSSIDDFTREARFESNVTIYRGALAIACSTADGTPEDRVAASKAADKLLSVRGVKATFAVVNIDGNVHISARSTGIVNVQLILEKLGGGGHFDGAGAQLKNAELDAGLKLLKGAIDEYLEESGVKL